MLARSARGSRCLDRTCPHHTRPHPHYIPVAAKARGLVWRIALFYVLLGVCWILFSDQVIAALFTDIRSLTRVQSWKGVAYMVGTGALLYLLLRPLVERLLEAQQRTVSSEARYREMFEANPGPMWTYDLTTMRIIDSNPAASAFLGWSRGELRGMEMHVLWPAESREYYEAGVAEIRAAPGRPYLRLERLRTSDGSHRDVEMRSSELVSGGEPRTQPGRGLRPHRRAAVAALARAGHVAPAGSPAAGPAGLVRGRRTHPARPFQPDPPAPARPAPGDDRDRALDEVLVAADPANQSRLDQLVGELAGGQQQKMDVLLPFIGGTGRERLLRLRVQRVEEGRRWLLRGTAQDVTEEQQTRRLLGEREQQFAELMRILPDAVMILSGEHVIYANPACAGMFGRQSEKLLGEALSALVEEADLPDLLAFLEAAGQARSRRHACAAPTAAPSASPCRAATPATAGRIASC